MTIIKSLEECKEDIKLIRQWLEKNPHLPQNIDDHLIRRFLHASDHSLEQTKNLIDLFFTIRSQAPEIFDNRDPTYPGIQAVLKCVDMIPLPKLTQNKEKVFLYRLRDPNPDNHQFIDGVKCFFMMADARMAEDKEIPSGEIPIFDMANYSLKHFTKIQLPIMKKYMLYTQEAHPVKLKQVHVINVPTFLDKILTFVKPFMKPEVAQNVHFHLPNSETLYEFIPKDILPEEYGGKGCKLAEEKKYWEKNLLDKRDYFLDESKWKVDENKRPTENSNNKQLFGMQGSFRALSID